MILQFLICATAQLAWDAPADTTGISHYRVYSKNELNQTYVMVSQVPLTQLQTTVTVKPMLAYEFFARSYDSVDNLESDDSNHVTFVRRPTLSIRTWKDGPLTQFEISTDAYAGLNWILEGTRNFSSWQTVSSGVAQTDAIAIPFTLPVGEDKMFFRLKKNVVSQMTLMRSVNLSEEDKISPLSYREPSRWERIKHSFRYRPGRSVEILKGGERQLQMLRPTPKPQIVLPPMPTLKILTNEEE